MKRNNSELTDYLIFTSLDIVKCKDCIHRPKIVDKEDTGRLILEFPDDVCICKCEDNYYSVYPTDDFYCYHGETK